MVTEANWELYRTSDDRVAAIIERTGLTKCRVRDVMALYPAKPGHLDFLSCGDPRMAVAWVEVTHRIALEIAANLVIAAMRRCGNALTSWGWRGTMGYNKRGCRGMILKLTNRGSLTLPPSLRRGLPSEALFDVVRREDGVIELRPKVAVDPDVAWFYSERWQQMEREADEDIAAGRVRSFESGEAFLAHLEAEDARLRAEGR